MNTDMTQNVKPRTPCTGNEMRPEQLMEQIRRVGFNIYETVLFLDVYPCSSEALAYLNKLKVRYAELVDQYETKFGPLTALGNRSNTEWRWIYTPWPWEYEAN